MEAAFPAGDVLMLQTWKAELFDHGNDLFVGESVVKHFIDDLADDCRKAADFAVGAAVGGFHGRHRGNPMILICDVSIMIFISSFHRAPGLPREDAKP